MEYRWKLHCWWAGQGLYGAPNLRYVAAHTLIFWLHQLNGLLPNFLPQDLISLTGGGYMQYWQTYMDNNRIDSHSYQLQIRNYRRPLHYLREAMPKRLDIPTNDFCRSCEFFISCVSQTGSYQENIWYPGWMLIADLNTCLPGRGSTI